MNINNLRPAWRQLKVLNSLDVIDQEEIMNIIEPKDELIIDKVRRLLSNQVLFLLLMLCCQGG